MLYIEELLICMKRPVAVIGHEFDLSLTAAEQSNHWSTMANTRNNWSNTP